MERRLQLLLDQERYDRVAAEAERSGRSVAAVIREAIDHRFEGEEVRARRRQACADLLASMEASEHEPYESPAELKVSLERELDEKFDRLYRQDR